MVLRCGQRGRCKMTAKLTLYSRKDCCLCDDMKAVINKVAANLPLEVDEIDVDSSSELQKKFGNDVPVLCIDGRKAFKHRMTAAELTRKLTRKRRLFLNRLLGSTGKESS
jgi:glutaredoxin